MPESGVFPNCCRSVTDWAEAAESESGGVVSAVPVAKAFTLSEILSVGFALDAGGGVLAEAGLGGGLADLLSVRVPIAALTPVGTVMFDMAAVRSTKLEL